VSSEEAHLRRQILRPSPAHGPYFQIRREDVVLEYPQSGRAHPMGSIFAEKTLYGSDAVITNPAKSGRASGSASRDANRLLRFYLRGSPFVSGPRSLRV
jgi:hypothetical protein